MNIAVPDPLRKEIIALQKEINYTVITQAHTDHPLRLVALRLRYKQLCVQRTKMQQDHGISANVWNQLMANAHRGEEWLATSSLLKMR